MNSSTETRSDFARAVARTKAVIHFIEIVSLGVSEELTEGLIEREELFGWANEAVFAETDSVVDAINVLGPTWVGSWDDLITTAHIVGEVEA